MIPPLKRGPLIDSFELEKETKINAVISSLLYADSYEKVIASFLAQQILKVPESQVLNAEHVKVFISNQVPKNLNLKEYFQFAHNVLILCGEFQAASDLETITTMKFSPINHSAGQWTLEDLDILRISFVENESWENLLFNSPLNDPRGVKFIEKNQNLTKDLAKNLKKTKTSIFSSELKNRFQRLVYMLYNKSQESVVDQLIDVLFGKLFEEEEFQLFPQQNLNLILNNCKYAAEPDRYLSYIPQKIGSVVVIEDKRPKSEKYENEYFAVPQLIAETIALLQQTQLIEKNEISTWPFEKEKYIFMIRVVGLKITFFRFKPNDNFMNAVKRGLRPEQKTVIEHTDINGKSLLDHKEREMIVKALINIKQYIRENF